MIRSLLPWLSRPGNLARRAPSWPGVKGRVLYAIGDIHGRHDCLSRALALIDADLEQQSEPSLEIYLGDFVDRGPSTRDVLETLMARSKSRDTVLLRGNHEVLMQEFFDRKLPFDTWRRLGGAETLMSYGIQNFETLHGIVDQATAAVVPPEHLSLLRGLRNYFVYDRYCFVHAGLRPNIELHRQSATDLTRIRGDFLNFKGDFGYTVVHGHTPVSGVDFHSNRINIDTGAYLTSRLSVLRIDETGPEVLGQVTNG